MKPYRRVLHFTSTSSEEEDEEEQLQQRNKNRKSVPYQATRMMATIQRLVTIQQPLPASIRGARQMSEFHRDMETRAERRLREICDALSTCKEPLRSQLFRRNKMSLVFSKRDDSLTSSRDTRNDNEDSHYEMARSVCSYENTPPPSSVGDRSPISCADSIQSPMTEEGIAQVAFSRTVERVVGTAAEVVGTAAEVVDIAAEAGDERAYYYVSENDEDAREDGGGQSGAITHQEKVRSNRDRESVCSDRDEEVISSDSDQEIVCIVGDRAKVCINGDQEKDRDPQNSSDDIEVVNRSLFDDDTLSCVEPGGLLDIEDSDTESDTDVFASAKVRRGINTQTSGPPIAPQEKTQEDVALIYLMNSDSAEENPGPRYPPLPLQTPGDEETKSDKEGRQEILFYTRKYRESATRTRDILKAMNPNSSESSLIQQMDDNLLEGTPNRQLQDTEFRCPICEKKLASDKSVKKHIRRMHDCERKYGCDMCSYRAFTAYQLKLHKRKHTGLYPIHCDHCDKGFNLPSAKKRHAEQFPAGSCFRMVRRYIVGAAVRGTNDAETAVHATNSAEPTAHGTTSVEEPGHGTTAAETVVHETNVEGPAVHEMTTVETEVHEATSVEAAGHGTTSVERGVLGTTSAEAAAHGTTAAETVVHETNVEGPVVYEMTAVETEVHEATSVEAAGHGTTFVERGVLGTSSTEAAAHGTTSIAEAGHGANAEEADAVLAPEGNGELLVKGRPGRFTCCICKIYSRRTKKRVMEHIKECHGVALPETSSYQNDSTHGHSNRSESSGESSHTSTELASSSTSSQAEQSRNEDGARSGTASGVARPRAKKRKTRSAENKEKKKAFGKRTKSARIELVSLNDLTQIHKGHISNESLMSKNLAQFGSSVSEATTSGIRSSLVPSQGHTAADGDSVDEEMTTADVNPYADTDDRESIEAGEEITTVDRNSRATAEDDDSIVEINGGEPTGDIQPGDWPAEARDGDAANAPIVNAGTSTIEPRSLSNGASTSIEPLVTLFEPISDDEIDDGAELRYEISQSQETILGMDTTPEDDVLSVREDPVEPPPDFAGAAEEECEISQSLETIDGMDTPPEDNSLPVYEEAEEPSPTDFTVTTEAHQESEHLLNALVIGSHGNNTESSREASISRREISTEVALPFAPSLPIPATSSSASPTATARPTAVVPRAYSRIISSNDGANPANENDASGTSFLTLGSNLQRSASHEGVGEAGELLNPTNTGINCKTCKRREEARVASRVRHQGASLFRPLQLNFGEDARSLAQDARLNENAAGRELTCLCCGAKYIRDWQRDGRGERDGAG